MVDVKEKLRLIKSGKLSAEENVRRFLEKIKENDKQGRKINAVLQINDDALLDGKEVDNKIRRGGAGRLAGLAIFIKANINVKGKNVSCASKTLENYKAGFDASVIKKIRAEDGIILGIANMDEFACGTSGESSAFGFTKNPASLDRIPGGSSSGSAACVAAEFCDLALGSDTGGSIRNPASHCGVVGFKPSYGAVSRYGLIDLSMSLEQIGPVANDVEGAELLFDVIRGKDENDATTIGIENKKIKKKITIGLVKVKADERIWELVRQRVEEVCRLRGWKMKDVSLKHIDLGVQTYYLINYVEFFSATRKFDGRRFGKEIEEVCGEEVLRRILGGAEISKEEFAGRYYKKALEAKKVIAREVCDALKKVDCLIMPTVPRLPHKLGEKIRIEDMYNYDSLTVLANLAGVPAISVPCGKIEDVPVGLQVVCAKGEDKRVFGVGRAF